MRGGLGLLNECYRLMATIDRYWTIAQDEIASFGCNDHCRLAAWVVSLHIQTGSFDWNVPSGKCKRLPQ
jgi:hypothetical protein